MSTDYIAPFALWIVVRRIQRRDGSCGVEPAWVGRGKHGGLAIFVSRLHAYVYAALRNIHRAHDDVMGNRIARHTRGDNNPTG